MKPNETPADIRREKKLLLEDLASRMKRAKQNISSFETGRLGATDEQIERWARGVGVSFERAYRAVWRAVLAQSRRKAREAQSRLEAPVPARKRA
jgi:transcriptional regulator with XRE-family HTH domain